MQSAHRDEGFTLVELLIAVVVGALIVGAIGAGVSIGIQSNSTTRLRLSESHDAEYAARWFSGDAASTEIGHFSASPSYTLPCADGVAGTSNIVTFGWTAPGASSSTVYEWVRQGSNLVRISCSGSTYTGELTMARNVSSTTAPTVTCDPNCTATAIKSVSLTVTSAADPRYPANPPYTYTLTGAVRGSAANSTLGPPPTGSPVPLLLLGATGSCGDPCDLQINGGGDNKDRPSPITVNGNAVMKGGTCTAAGGHVSCPPYTVDPNVPDPYATLPVPPKPAQTYTDGQDHGCGTYTTTLAITGDDVLNSAKAPDCVYYLEQGMSVTGNGAVTTSAAGALFYIAGGYGQYTAFNCGGTATCSLKPISDKGNVYGQANVVIFASRTLKPPTWPAATYGLYLVGSDKGDQGKLWSYDGVVYAPVETVYASGNGSIDVTGVVSLNMQAGGNGTGTFGQ